MKTLFTLCFILLLHSITLAQYYIIFFAYPKGTVVDGDESRAGHAYVSFVRKDAASQQTVLDAKWGFHPTDPSSNMAVWRDLGAVLTERYTFTNQTVDFIVETGNIDIYNNCLSLKNDWINKRYGLIAGNTCVTFARDIAKMIPGLNIPNALIYQAPKPFLAHLKQLNTRTDAESRKSLSELSPANKPCIQHPEIVDNFTPEYPHFHEYTVESEICSVDEYKSANKASVFAILLKHNFYVAPTKDSRPVTSCSEVNLNAGVVVPGKYDDDPILTVIDNSKYTVINYTMPAHRLHAGKVVREIIQRGNKILLRTHGTGNNKNYLYKKVNGSQISMDFFWKSVDKKFINDVKETLDEGRNTTCGFTWQPWNKIAASEKAAMKQIMVTEFEAAPKSLLQYILDAIQQGSQIQIAKHQFFNKPSYVVYQEYKEVQSDFKGQIDVVVGKGESYLWPPANVKKDICTAHAVDTQTQKGVSTDNGVSEFSSDIFFNDQYAKFIQKTKQPTTPAKTTVSQGTSCSDRFGAKSAEALAILLLKCLKTNDKATWMRCMHPSDETETDEVSSRRFDRHREQLEAEGISNWSNVQFSRLTYPLRPTGSQKVDPNKTVPMATIEVTYKNQEFTGRIKIGTFVFCENRWLVWFSGYPEDDQVYRNFR